NAHFLLHRPAPPSTYPLSLHDALPILDDPHVRAMLPEIAKPIVTYGLADDAQLRAADVVNVRGRMRFTATSARMPNLAVELAARSEEHTSELQSLAYLVCRLLLEKKKK